MLYSVGIIFASEVKTVVLLLFTACCAVVHCRNQYFCSVADVMVFYSILTLVPVMVLHAVSAVQMDEACLKVWSHCEATDGQERIYILYI